MQALTKTRSCSRGLWYRLTEERDLAIDRAAETKSELLNGQMFTIADGTVRAFTKPITPPPVYISQASRRHCPGREAAGRFHRSKWESGPHRVRRTPLRGRVAAPRRSPIADELPLPAPIPDGDNSGVSRLELERHVAVSELHVLWP